MEDNVVRVRFIVWHWLVLCLLVIFAGCSKDNDEPKQLVVTPDKILLNDNDEGEINIKSNTTWSIDTGESWLTVSHKSGKNDQKVTIHANSKNETQQSREAKVKIFDNEKSIIRTVIVSQKPAPVPERYLVVNPTELLFTSKSEQKSIEISSNVTWTVKSNATWCTISKASGKDNEKIEVSVTSNNSTTSRSTTIIINGGESPVTINVKQSGQNEELTVDKTNIDNVPASGGNYSVNLTANLSWTASSNQSWCSVSSKSGDNSALLGIKVEPNKNTNARNAEITIKGGSITRTIKVNQLAEDYYLDVDKSIIEFIKSESNNAFTINSNVSWNISGTTSWCSVSPNNGSNSKTVGVMVTENTSINDRTTELKISGGQIEKKVKITQYGTDPVLSNSPSDLSFSPSAGNKTTSLRSNMNWTAISSDSWCKVSPNSGNGNSTLTINVESNTVSNSRSTTISVKGEKGKTITISVKQEGISLTVNKSSIQLSSSESTNSFIVTSNAAWTASSNSSWCTLSPVSGSSGSNTVTIKATKNTLSSERNAKITLKSGSVTLTINVTQSPPSSLTLSTETMSFGYSSSSKSVSLYSNTSWTLSSSQSWLSYSPSKGSNDSKITITASTNTGTSARSAILTARTTDGSISRTINVTQEAGPYLNISSSAISVDCYKQSKSITITSNTSWSISDDASWISCSPTSGSNNGTLTINIAANTGDGRVGTITLRSKDGSITKTIKITQGKYVYIEVSPTSITTPKTGGTYKINVKSNTTWYAFKGMSNYGSSWISISPSSGSGNGTVTVKASSNSNSAAYATVVISTVSGVQNSTSKVVTIRH